MTAVGERGDLRQEPAARPRRTPYQGLLPYTEEDADYFFGRTAWREIVTDHLLAYRVTLLYGPSGVGKSSLLRAGVVHRLSEEAAENVDIAGRPDLLPTIVASWSGDPLASVEVALQAAAAKLWSNPPRRPQSGSLSRIVSSWAAVAGRVLLILDQFDEYFMYHESRSDNLAFVDALSELIGNREIPVNVLISIREDAVAKLDRFDSSSVDLWQNMLRIDHLDSDAAREAIEMPIQRWNELEVTDGTPISIESKLVDAVVGEANTRTVSLTAAGRGVVDGGAQEDCSRRVEAPYLQLVLTRLWEEERRRGSAVLRLDTLNRLGGAEQIVRRHFDLVMRELPKRQRSCAAKILEYLVTPAGTKIALPPSALARWSKQKEKKITPILVTLAGGEQRILRTVSSAGDPSGTTSYEIFHDRLAEGILDWRRRYVRRRRITRIAIVVGAVLLAVGVGGGIVLYEQHQRAARLSSDLNQLREEQQSRLKRLQKSETALAKKSPYFEKMLPPHSGSVYSADFSPDSRRVATAGEDGSVVMADPATGRQLQAANFDDGATRVVFSPHGGAIGVEGYEGRAGVWDGNVTDSPVEIAARGVFNSLAFSSDGSSVVTAAHRGSAQLWSVATGKRRAVFRPRSKAATSDTAIISPDGRLVAAAAGKWIRIWEVRSGRLRKKLPSEGSPTDIQFAPHANLLLAVGRKSATIWNVNTWHGTAIAVPRRGITTISNGGNPDLSRLADFSNGRIVIAGATSALVSTVNGKRLATLPHGQTTTTARFSLDGSIIVTGTARGEILAWSSKGRPLATLLPGRVAAVESLAFSPDGRLLVSASENGTSAVWNIKPDLAIAAAEGTVGPDGVAVLVRVSNRGLREASPSHLVIHTLGGSRATAVGSLLPGRSRTFSFVLPHRGSRRETIVIRVIPRDRRSEALQSNNEKTIQALPPPG